MRSSWIRVVHKPSDKAEEGKGYLAPGRGPHDDSGRDGGDGSTNLRKPRTAGNPRNRKGQEGPASEAPLTPDFRLLASRTMI